MLAENRLQYAKDALDLTAVSLHGAGDFLGVIVEEPGNLAEVRALTRGLEVEPLKLGILLFAITDEYLVLLVVLLDEVLKNSIGFPVDVSINMLCNH